ncbi:CDC42 effector protein (Rho GTPase binding) 4 (predicted), isoform CRA_a [Rattus norvegicus]|uniref:CDC42 effector protein (Rho GTPase binding) 4 (Predicted), isoform CRA_a n=2 Tax=Rattus norvegicus TaxID=10116 RepID=A0A8I5Y758_RAT|nr:cdc42 effector protein 4 [Rattus norvegicus]XP_006247750.1 cdc42 effector protein 4 isoform X1 [Rattus norvegicus]XP_006247751.1 cdc42 effector protein 4 isoform X1 [Rattus norvegicus]XP_006247752.1 cdc42 effector protein 4 isoform X1 [Rattus norvegicus]XP_038942109.1 cdc42 effector protein 4 isoform X1 [Rattus norvegicus]XP_038942110.1 cdc42 effector protein 4 isoform X1 [Rattus norvegicus]AAI61986.1 Cdc42ep4 protein [Rattus norvegicus]EDM06527.1 CDC42 effector protein (Rho GTPase bindin|eukprot:NP_001100533.1 cdc42 effector protein 4 [Rattus norvegicus]
MPILKQLVSGSVNSKRRSRADLTAEMISAPLGDFRHTMHVGRGGDAFGDTSFLTSKTGEPDGESLDEQATSSKLSLLSRKFRGSKRSQSVTRGDREQRDMLGSLRDSSLFVKNAMSLPQLNEKEATEKDSSKLPKSLSSSPVKKADTRDGSPKSPHRNGATGPHSPDPLLDEQAFGDLMDLPVMPKVSYGLKHAESILSFHIDLGPSMLGDVLSIMDKDQWGSEEEGEEEGGIYRVKEGPGGIVQGPPMLEASPRGRQESKASWDHASMLPHHALEDDGWAAVAPSPSSARSVGSHTTRDSSSLSSYTSGVLEERSPAFRGPDRVGAAPPRQPDKEFSFMDEEEEDEIRV